MSEMSALVGQEFAYAHGRMGVLKQLLLTQSDVDRLLGAHSIAEVQKILTELKLTSVIDQGVSNWMEILTAVGAWVRHEVEMMSPASHRPTFHILWLEGDAPVLKYLLKKAHGHTSEISQMPHAGIATYDSQDLSALVLDGKEGSLPAHLVSFVKETLSIDSLSVEEIDSTVATYIAGLQMRLARANGSAAIHTFVEHRIDLHNIRTALRSHENHEQHFLTGGTIPMKDLQNGPENVVKAIMHSSLSIVLPDADSFASDTTTFEMAAAHVSAHDIAHMWNVPLSIEPLFAFAAIATAQLRLIRAVCIAKGNELSPQETKGILPPFLSASSFTSTASS